MRILVAHIAHRAGLSIALITLLIIVTPNVCNAEKRDTCRFSPIFTIRTNTLYDAYLIPNIGAELELGKGWTVQLDWHYTWFSSDRRHRYWQCYGGYLTAKKYFEFPEWITDAPLTGHHVGFYLSALTYDVEWGGKGYQADHFGFGGGVEYGYSCRLSRKMKLDITLGIGFQDGEYKTYEPSGDHYDHYVWTSTSKRHWWGPTKLEASLAWFFGGKKKCKAIETVTEKEKGGGL